VYVLQPRVMSAEQVACQSCVSEIQVKATSSQLLPGSATGDKLEAVLVLYKLEIGDDD